MFGLNSLEMLGLVIWVLTPIAFGLLAWRKGYQPGLWMLLAVFVPVLGLLILACLPFRGAAVASATPAPLDDRLMQSMRDVLKARAERSTLLSRD
jgi:hypothetical protein